MLHSIKWFLWLLWKSFRLLKRNNPLILASSTAFFTTFSLSPILVLLVSVLGFYFSNDMLNENIFARLKDIFGEESSEEIARIVKNMGSFEGNWLISILGFLFLLFIATTLLQVIRQAINLVWKIRRKQKQRMAIRVMERTRATLLLLIMGGLFLVSLLLDAATTLLHKQLHAVDVHAHELLSILNIGFSLLVVTAWFTILFRMLPDGKPRWRVALAGGLLTSLFFSVGKWVLGRLLIHSVAENVFGASASFALILLFIFYTSFILYYGASFTYIYGEETNRPISAGKYGDRFQIRVVGSEDETEGPLIE